MNSAAKGLTRLRVVDISQGQRALNLLIETSWSDYKVLSNGFYRSSELV